MDLNTSFIFIAKDFLIPIIKNTRVRTRKDAGKRTVFALFKRSN